MTRPLISRSGACPSYFGGVAALTDVDLDVRSNEILGLIGPNGAGKSTLVDCITGFTRPGSGTITFNRQDFARLGPHRRARSGVTRSFQTLELFDDLTVRETSWPRRTTMLSGDTHRISFGDVRAGSRGLPPGFGRGRVGGCTGAPDQRTALRPTAAGRHCQSHGFLSGDRIARRAGRRSRLGRDRRVRAVLRRMVTEWKVGIVVIEHDLSMIMSICDRVAVLDFGRKIADGTVAEIAASPEVRTAYLGDDFQDLSPDVMTAAADRSGPASRCIRGRACGRRRRLSTVLDATDISAGYGLGLAIRDISIRGRGWPDCCAPGTEWGGEDDHAAVPCGRAAAQIGHRDDRWYRCQPPATLPTCPAGLLFITEESAVFRRLTVRDNFRVCRCNVDDALESFPELVPLLNRRAGSLSGGEQQIVAVARALARRPKVLLADELSLGLAPMVVRRLLNALRDAADAGLGVLLVEQHVQNALAVSDWIYLLGRGRIVTQGSPRELGTRLEDVMTSYLSTNGEEEQM